MADEKEPLAPPSLSEGASAHLETAAPGEMAAQSPKEMAEEGHMPLWQHLDELRTVLIRSLLSLCLSFCITYYFSEQIVGFLEKPLLRILPPGEKHLYFTGITDKFFVYIKVSVYAAIAMASPYLLRQIWLFISPGLRAHERKAALPFLVLGSLSFFVGMAFAYYVVIPSGYDFLVHFGSANDKPIISLVEYFGLTTQLLLALGVVFELPVVLMLLAKLGIVQPALLTRFRPHAYVGLAVVAGFVTPTPDAFTMLIVLVPLLLLYELSVQIVKWVVRKPLATEEAS